MHTSTKPTWPFLPRHIDRVYRQVRRTSLIPEQPVAEPTVVGHSAVYDQDAPYLFRSEPEYVAVLIALPDGTLAELKIAVSLLWSEDAPEQIDRPTIWKPIDAGRMERCIGDLVDVGPLEELALQYLDDNDLLEIL